MPTLLLLAITACWVDGKDATLDTAIDSGLDTGSGQDTAADTATDTGQDSGDPTKPQSGSGTQDDPYKSKALSGYLLGCVDVTVSEEPDENHFPLSNYGEDDPDECVCTFWFDADGTLLTVAEAEVEGSGGSSAPERAFVGAPGSLRLDFDPNRMSGGAGSWSGRLEPVWTWTTPPTGPCVSRRSCPAPRTALMAPRASPPATA